MEMLDAAYLAGLIDGEGCIRISRLDTKPNPRYRIEVSLHMTTRDCIDFARSLIGGSVCLRKHPAPCRDSYQWTAWNKRAAEMLQTLLPFLKLKRAHAKLAIALYDHLILHGNSRYVRGTSGAVAHAKDIIAARETMHADMHILNARGR